MQAPALPAGEHARLILLQRAALLDTPPEQALDRLVKLAAETFRVPIALISLVDRERQWFKAKVGLEACETPRDISFCGHVVAQDKMLVVNNALLDTRFADNPLVVDGPQIRFYAGAPLRLVGAHVIGTLCLIDSHPREFPPQDQQHLQMLADTVCELVRQRMALQLLEQQCQLLLTINRAQASFLLNRDMPAACQEILSPLLTLSHSQLGFIARCHLDDSDTLLLDIPLIEQHDPRAMAWLGPLLQPYQGGHCLRGFDNVLASALSDGETLVINHPRLYAQEADSPLAQLDSLLAVPCFFHGTIKGLIVLVNRAGGYDEEMIALLESAAENIGSLLHVQELEHARQRAEAELAQQATLDPLTGLHNRRAFLDKCQQAIDLFARYQTVFSVLMLDLDHFKHINDQFGHAAGDYVLQEVANLLRQQLRETDQIARWGGEEFCVLLPQEDASKAMQLTQRLLTALRGMELQWGVQTISVTASIGVAEASSHQEALNTLLAKADRAMYQAKQAGRDCCVLADS